MVSSISSLETLFPKEYPDFVYNFAYGSNMSPRVLSGRRKIHPIESIPGVLEGWQLTFDLRGIPGVEPCFGNIKENSESEIHGVLHQMTGQDFKRLLATEGGGGVDRNGYIPLKVDVHAYDGRIIQAYALVVRQTSPAILNQHSVPSFRYMGLLRDGATHFKIHPLYIEYLQSLPSNTRSTPVTVLVIAEALLLVTVTSPYWAPIVLYYVLTNQKANARAFFFTWTMTNLWRIYRWFGGRKSIQPYYSASFPLGSTNFKENTKDFRTDVQNDEKTLDDTVSNSLSKSISVSELPPINT